MPNYAGSDQATALAPGDSALALSADTVPGAGLSSLAFSLQRAGGQPYGESWEINFSGAPGVFEVDVQHADTDTDAAYVTVNTVSAVNTNNYARVELPACWSRFSRLRVASLANAVTVTARITR